MFYDTSPAGCKSPEIVARSIGTDPTGWLAWWREQALIDGTDWRNLVEAAEQILRQLRVLHLVEASS
jgi:hypothetical protein